MTEEEGEGEDEKKENEQDEESFPFLPKSPKDLPMAMMMGNSLKMGTLPPLEAVKQGLGLGDTETRQQGSSKLRKYCEKIVSRAIVNRLIGQYSAA